jgi:hypothetical protein
MRYAAAVAARDDTEVWSYTTLSRDVQTECWFRQYQPTNQKAN